MKINRFTKNVSPAEFNPLTAEEIMRVPLLKGAIEQEQLAGLEEKRLELLNADVAPGDLDRVRAEQDRLNSKFDKLSYDISTKGVNASSTEDLNKFIRDYNTSTSKSGIIGSAAEFAKDRKAKMAADRALAIERGYNMSDWEKLYNAHDLRQSSVDSNGNRVTEFSNINLPARIDPKLMLRDAMKSAGSIRSGSTLGDFREDNKRSIASSIKGIINKYNSDPEFRQLMVDLGYENINQLNKVLKTEGNILYKENIRKHIEKEESEKIGKSEKDKKSKTDPLENEVLFNIQETPIHRAEDRFFTNSQLLQLKRAAEVEGATQEDIDTFVEAEKRTSELKREYDELYGGSKWKRLIEEDKRALETGEGVSEDDFEKVDGEVLLVDEGQEVYDYVLNRSGNSYTKIPKDNYRVKVGDKYALISKNSDIGKRLHENVKNYEEGLNDYIGTDKLHKSRDVYTLVSKAAGTGKDSNQNLVNKIKSSFNDIFKDMSPNTTPVNSHGYYMKNGEEIEVNDDDSTPELNLKNAKKKLSFIKPENIHSVKLGVPTESRGGTIYVDYSSKELINGNEETVYRTLELDLNPESFTNDSAVQNLINNVLPGTIQGKQIKEAFLNHNKYRNIKAIPAYSDFKYSNSDRIKEVVSKGTIGSTFKGDDLNISEGPEGFILLKRDSKTKDLKSDDVGEVIGYKDLFKPYEIDNDPITTLINIKNSNPLLMRYINDAYFEKLEELNLPNSLENKNKYLPEVYNNLKSNNVRLLASTKGDLLNIIGK